MMKNNNKLEKIGIAIGSIFGYIVILAGIILTILLLQTVFYGE